MDSLILIIVVFWFLIGLGSCFALLMDRRNYGDVLFALLMIAAWPVLLGARIALE